ncbi:hypothetical protein N7519_009185 [Penicillium mononematosum]|uniref:uncharacterized protein n=1 Tax=Penicillium mononematosum TaxID=268346 RepID=UPI00254904F3|nr:uncharacterized protein N7519_009185 [Penicillium mononematosum]KAJ6178724.1 hypothetical protein N7519_009185 [Penicillium mononematosum]
MNRDRQAEPSRGLIRRFSDDVSQSSPCKPLNRALAAKVAFDRNRERSGSLRDEWDQLLSEGRELADRSVPDEEAVLFHQSQRLHTAWSKFQRNLPEDQLMQLRDHERPDINFLMATVKKASATWQSDREESTLGKVKSKFRGLCETCHDHSSLLAMIPKDEKYVTLLTGSLSAIVQATINHQNIAEGVADTLDDLGHDIDFWNRQMREHGNIPALRRYIQELYVIVFEFFTEIFNKWSKSSWKRFLTSFDEGAFNKLFTSKKSRLLAIEHRMERDINLDFRHRTMTSLERVIQYQEKLFNFLPDRLAEQRLLLGESLQMFLEQQQSFHLESHQSVSATSITENASTSMSPASTSADSVLRLPEPEINPVRRAHFRYNRTEIQAELTIFTTQWKNQVDHLIQAATQSSLLRLDKEVHYRLMTWLRDLNSTNVWIRGPHDVSRPSQNSMTAVSMAALARTHNIPCIIYFCTFTDHYDSIISKKADIGFFLASIVTQLVQFIPDKGYTEADLSSARFAALEQGALGVEETLQLIRDVRSVGPKLVYGFIDNLQVLEDRSNEAYTGDFLRAIMTLCRLDRGSQSPGSVVTTNEKDAIPGTKICFTTDGYVDGLAQAAELQLADRIEYDLETTDPMSGEVGGPIVWDMNGKDNTTL